MSPALLTLVWLLCVCTITLGVYIYINNAKYAKEGFNYRSRAEIRITKCPQGTTSYITSTGDTHCCEGDIQHGKCKGTTVCSLSPMREGGKIQTCSNIMTYLWAQRTYDWCPEAMYFYGTMGNRRPSGPGIDPNIWGCSSSKPKLDGTKPDAPAGTTIDFCTIYGSNKDNLATVTTAAVAADATGAGAKPAVVESCRNRREIQKMETPTPTASRTMVNTSSSARKTPALFNASFTPIKNVSANPTPVTCTNWPRFKLYLQHVFPSAIPAYESIQGKHVYWCTAAKAYYIDGTLSASNAIGVPSGNSLPGICPPPAAATSSTSTAACPPAKEYCADEVKRQVAEKIAEFKKNPLGTAANLGKAGLGAARKFFGKKK